MVDATDFLKFDDSPLAGKLDWSSLT